MTEFITLDDRVRKLIAEHLGVRVEVVNDDADLTDDLGADSLDPVEICTAIEEQFGIEVPDDAEWKTAGDILKTVKGMRGG